MEPPFNLSSKGLFVEGKFLLRRQGFHGMVVPFDHIADDGSNGLSIWEAIGEERLRRLMETVVPLGVGDLRPRVEFTAQYHIWEKVLEVALEIKFSDATPDELGATRLGGGRTLYIRIVPVIGNNGEIAFCPFAGRVETEQSSIAFFIALDEGLCADESPAMIGVERERREKFKADFLLRCDGTDVLDNGVKAALFWDAHVCNIIVSA